MSTWPPARSRPLPDHLYDRLKQIESAHASLPVPDYVGHVMGIPPRPTAEHYIDSIGAHHLRRSKPWTSH